jgi:hypothetical protein
VNQRIIAAWSAGGGSGVLRPLLSAQGDEVRKLLKDSEIAWNHGDLAAFASYCEGLTGDHFRSAAKSRTAARLLARCRRTLLTRKPWRLTFSKSVALSPGIIG